MMASAQPLAIEYDVALLDLDGVVYVGAQAIPGAPAALAAARGQGMRLAFVTNNASRTPEQVAALLTGMEVPAQPSEVITSSHAAAHYLADRLPNGSAVLVLGTTGLIEALTERGLKPVFSADDEPLAVAQGYSPELDWHALAEGMVAIRRGAQWVATNLDPTVPSPRGPLPGNGALVAALRHATGMRPVSTGKPDPTMHAESVQRSGAKHPLVVGDRLDTDIEGARRADCAALLVLTGVTSPADLLAATTAQRPDYLGRDLNALLTSHPKVNRLENGFGCGSAVVRIDDRDLSVGAGLQSEEGDGLDPLRALSAAAWSLSDAGLRPAGLVATDKIALDLLSGLGLPVKAR
ncbi:HAD-IIA family hydrolase [Jatrophihabitans sp. DSM 45814]